MNDTANSLAKNTKIVLWSCNKTAAQNAENDHWTHESNGEYVLKSHNGKLCLDDPANSKANGTQLIVYTCKDTANQRWSLP